eukprot:CAMPEP_0176231220 /NCGR_PEP_ID=MMETSP0121_2-20121125/24691_1 /TAXON_ID=160619 /ORGANISM="Kryptoperidinium foliaceum, Strain CCMP 1326" /LENGTH=78 /DNA_ID=CAMNT_0017570565 /DNA_START=64 /DNA_END=298 /DNA_ORIENTATION=+
MLGATPSSPLTATHATQPHVADKGATLHQREVCARQHGLRFFQGLNFPTSRVFPGLEVREKPVALEVQVLDLLRLAHV